MSEIAGKNFQTKRLPYLKRVAYLESAGTQWIDAGLAFRSGYAVDIDVKVNSHETSTQVIFGFSANAGYWVGNASGKFSIGGSNFLSSSLARTSLHATFGANSISVTDGEKTITRAYSGTNAPLTVFTASAGQTYFSYASIYSMKIMCGEDTVLDLIPVLDLSGRPCMYNKVASLEPADSMSRFFYNSGTGEFSWGEI